MKYILENKVFKTTLYEIPSIEILKKFDDTSLSNEDIFREIRYTIVGRGILSHSIGRFFPSSKMCSNCGWINQDLTLSIREWTCPSCDEIHDRDFNASKNILKQGLKILSGSGIESDIKQKQVEALPLGESMKPETH